MPVSVKTKATLRAPNLDLSNELKYIADRIIIRDIQNNIMQGKQVDGSSYPQRSEAYTKWKRKKVGHSIPMVLWDKLRNALASRRVGMRQQQIYVRAVKSNNKGDNTTRDKVGQYLQQVGNVWFGISNYAEQKSIAYLATRIKSILRNGR